MNGEDFGVITFLPDLALIPLATTFPRENPREYDEGWGFDPAFFFSPSSSTARFWLVSGSSGITDPSYTDGLSLLCTLLQIPVARLVHVPLLQKVRGFVL